MSQATYVIQGVSRPECFCIMEKRAGRIVQRAVLAPFLDNATEFESSFAAQDFASRNFAPHSYVVRTMVNGYLLPLGRKEGVNNL